MNKDFGEMPQMAQLPVTSLVIDDRYQRQISGQGKKNIVRIAKEFRWEYFGVVLVTDNGDGTYAIIDGQHRVEAVKKISEIKVVPCVIVTEMSLKDQAKTFLAFNVSRTSLTPKQIYHARLRGGDAEIISVNNLVTDIGMYVPKNNIKEGDPVGAIECWKTLLKFYKSDKSRLIQILDILKKAYQLNSRDHREWMVKAIYHCLNSCEITTEALADVVSTKTAHDWRDLANRTAKKDTQIHIRLAEILFNKSKV